MDGRNTGRMGFSHAAENSAENMMAAVKAGKIRKHLANKTAVLPFFLLFALPTYYSAGFRSAVIS